MFLANPDLRIFKAPPQSPDPPENVTRGAGYVLPRLPLPAFWEPAPFPGTFSLPDARTHGGMLGS